MYKRQGFEFAVSKAEVLYKYDERNRKLEPMEIAYVDVPDDFTGAVIQKLTSRKGELQGMSPIGSGYTRLEFSIPVSYTHLHFNELFKYDQPRQQYAGRQSSGAALF